MSIFTGSHPLPLSFFLPCPPGASKPAGQAEGFQTALEPFSSLAPAKAPGEPECLAGLWQQWMGWFHSVSLGTVPGTEQVFNQH